MTAVHNTGREEGTTLLRSGGPSLTAVGLAGKACTDREFLEAVFGTESQAYRGVVTRARQAFDMSEATATRYLARLKPANMISHSGGLY